MILSGEDKLSMDWAKKFRDGAINSKKWELYNQWNPNNQIFMKSDWLSNAKGDKGFEAKSFANKQELLTYLNSTDGYNALKEYVKNKGLIKFKGMNSSDHLELMIWDNMLRKYKDMNAIDELRGDANRDLELDVREFSKWYSTIWKKYFDGTDHVMDQNRVSTIVEDKMEKLFEKWEDSNGAGKLFLWKLMAPQTDQYNFTYFNRRISPAFKTHSLSRLKLGLKFINNAPNHIFTEFEKNMVFGYMSGWYNNSFRAHHGQRGDYSTIESTHLSNINNRRIDIYQGAPLLDNIKGWEPGIQETDLNPEIGKLFGLDNRGVAHSMAHQSLMPSAVADIMKASWWAYMPTAYIPENVNIGNYPSINGWRNYQNAVAGDARIMLGHSSKLNLLFKSPTTRYQQPYEKIQPKNGANDRSDLNEDILNKVGEGNC